MPELAEIFRREAGRCTATLIRILGDIDLAEEAVAKAFAIAAEQWPTKGVPPNPGGWITTTARNRAIDRLRRESTRSDRHLAALRPEGDGMPPDHDPDHDPGLDALDSLDVSLLEDYQPYHAARADLLARAGRRGPSVAAYDRAIELTANLTERHFLERQRKTATDRT